MMTLATETLDMTAVFKALSDPTRRSLYEFLCTRCCPVALEEDGAVRPVDGPTVGEVCCVVTGLSHIPSRVSFHLRELRLAGLITMEKRGKNVICGVNQPALDALRDYMNGLHQSGLGCC